MGFNVTKFTKQKFEHRTDDVEVPALEAWFDLPEVEEGAEKPSCLWRVRGLMGSEFARMMDSANKEANLTAIIEAISDNNSKVQELREAIGVGDDTPANLKKRLQQLVLGSVDPKIDDAIAVKLATNFPIEFYTLTNRITELTGLGLDIKK